MIATYTFSYETKSTPKLCTNLIWGSATPFTQIELTAAPLTRVGSQLVFRHPDPHSFQILVKNLHGITWLAWGRDVTVYCQIVCPMSSDLYFIDIYIYVIIDMTAHFTTVALGGIQKLKPSN